MQTFLPCGDFRICAKLLDNARLVRQIQECLWVAERLRDDYNKIKGRRSDDIGLSGSHAVVGLWKLDDGTPLFAALRDYQRAMHKEYQVRFSTTFKKTHASFRFADWLDSYPSRGRIRWTPTVHQSHLQKLIWKDRTYYIPKARYYELDFTDPKQTEPSYFWSRPYIESV